MNWFCQRSGLNCNDLRQAISDISLQLNVTVIFLLVLVIVGVLFALVSRLLTDRIQPKKPLKQQPVAIQRPMNHKLKLRAQRGLYMPVQVDTIHADTAPKSSWWSGFWQGISTEFFGAVVTIILLGLGVVVFEQYQDIQNRKAALILQMGSDERVWAVEATRQLNALGWLEDGTLTRVDLQYADLTDANLGRANLTHTNLERANLTDANLGEAKLTDANLAYGNLTDTFLVNADLTNAYLLGVNLTDANLEYADLTGAYLEYANLTGARFSENTILPDNTNWTPDSDLTRFTDPDHPDFWDICVRDTIRPWYC